MEQEQALSPQYIKGFNAGYNLQQTDPELLDLIISGNADFLKAAKAGKKQLELEQPKKEKEQNQPQKKPSRPTWLENDRLKDISKNSKKGKDIEPDM